MLVTLRKAPPRYTQPGKAPDIPEWLALHRIADRHITTMQAAFLRAVAAAKLAIPPGRTDFAETVMAQVLLAWENAGRPALASAFLPELTAIVTEAAVVSQPAVLAVATGTTAQLQAAFFQVNATAARIAATLAGTHIQQITETTLSSTRAILVRAFTEGRTPDDTARDLRRFIGLTERQTMQAQRYEQGLRTGRLSYGRIQELVDRRTQRLLAQRAEVIARHETMTASLAGQHELWQATQQYGYLPEGMRRFAIITFDDRLCPYCRLVPGLNLEGRGLDEMFATPFGPILHPPFHIQCRCAVSMREVA